MIRKVFLFCLIAKLSLFCTKKLPDDILEEAFKYPAEITELNLGLTELKKVPEKISLFKNLEILDLRMASLNNLPEEIGDLKKLKILILYGNKLTKLPDSFVELQSLENFLAGKNRFEKIPNQLASLKKLKNIHLEQTLIRFTEEDVEVLSKISSLEILELTKNKHITVTPSNIGLLKGLKKLIIKKSKLPPEEKKKIVEALRGTEIKF